jgi:hypothetical protein
LGLPVLTPQQWNRGQAELAKRAPGAVAGGAKLAAALAHRAADHFFLCWEQRRIGRVVESFDAGYLRGEDPLNHRTSRWLRTRTG